MVRLFKHYIPHAVLLLGVLDLALLFLAADLAWNLRASQIGIEEGSLFSRAGPLAGYAVTTLAAMIAVGVYGPEALRSLRFACARILVAISLAILALAVLDFLLPGQTYWRSTLLYAMVLAIVLLVLNRGFAIVGFVSMTEAATHVAEAVPRPAIGDLSAHVARLGASEVVLALEERRNSLPLKDLLRVKTAGVHVNEFSSFLERETGRVDLDTLNPSWLIFSDGFSSGRAISSVAKRAFDIFASGLLLLLTFPVIAIFAIIVKLDSRGPAFFRQKRVGLYGQTFELIKLRSMRTDAEKDGSKWAQENDPRITRVGAFIRKVRIDVLPQVWTVLRGHMNFVGPRPEVPTFVDDLEDKPPYYAERHMVKPGITGWAQINYPHGANIEDSRPKLEYDLYYAKNYTPFLDLLIMLQTPRVVLWPEGAR